MLVVEEDVLLALLEEDVVVLASVEDVVDVVVWWRADERFSRCAVRGETPEAAWAGMMSQQGKRKGGGDKTGAPATGSEARDRQCRFLAQSVCLCSGKVASLSFVAVVVLSFAHRRTGAEYAVMQQRQWRRNGGWRRMASVRGQTGGYRMSSRGGGDRDDSVVTILYSCDLLILRPRCC